MPASKLSEVAKDPRAQSVALALVASALFVSVTKVEANDPQREDKLAALGESLKGRAAQTQPASADKLDTATIHAEIRKIRDADPALVDLGGGIVEPGATYTTGVNLSKGTKLVAFESCDGHLNAESLVCVLDPGAWAFSKVKCQERDASTWCEVTVRNTGDKAQRLLVLVRTEGP